MLPVEPLGIREVEAVLREVPPSLGFIPRYHLM
jgi:hypothetical protein